MIGDLKQIYKNESVKACFGQDAPYSDNKYSAKWTISDNVLRYRACEIAITPKYDGNQGGLASMIYKLFDKKTGSGTKIESKPHLNEKLRQELQKTLFKYNIFAANFAKIGLLSSFNRGVKYLIIYDGFLHQKILRLSLWRIKKLKQFFMVSFKQ